MKIRHPVLLKALGFTAAWVVRWWIGTVRYRYRPLGPNFDPNQPNFQGHFIYAFWHENILMPAYQYGRPDIWVLISQHADGQLIAETCRHLGFRSVRGSSTRGSFEAVRKMIRKSKKGHLAVTPDGPRGPRRKVQPGLIYLAARTGLPIVPIGISFHNPWRLRSWDSFALPRPYSYCTVVTTEPISVPPDLGKAKLEFYRQSVEQALSLATETAEGHIRRAAAA